jgi:hypothetical protein
LAAVGLGQTGAVTRGRHAWESGQTIGEYAVVIAGIAVVCLVAALFVGSIVANRIRDAPSQPHTSLEPPRTSPQLVWPRRLEDCENGGWRNYVQFENERQCKDYVRDMAS